MKRLSVNLRQRALYAAPPEARLLLASIRGERILASSAAALNAAQGAQMLEFAERHGITPLLCRALPAEAASLPALAPLYERYGRGVHEALLLAGTMVQLGKLLEAAGIPTIPFKGPALAAYAYGDLALRPAGDLDLLIRQCDFARARELMLAQGFEPALQLSAQEEQRYLDEHNDFAFVHPGNKLVVELQWRVMQTPFAFPPDVDAWWARLGSAELAHHSVRAFTPEDLLLILCVHGGKHAWERLLWISDIAALLRTQPQLNWARVFGLARSYQSTRMVLIGLLLAHQLCGAPMPEVVVAEAELDAGAVRLAADVARSLFRPIAPDAMLDEKPFFYLWARESWRERLHIVWTCFPSLRNPYKLISHYVIGNPRLHRLGRRRLS